MDIALAFFCHMAAAVAIALPVVVPPREFEAVPKPVVVPPRICEAAPKPLVVPPRKCEAAPEPVVVPEEAPCEVEVEVASPVKVWKPDILLDPANYTSPDRCVPELFQPSRWTESKSKPLPPPMSLVPGQQWGDGSYVLSFRCLDEMSLTTWQRLQQNKRKSWLMLEEDPDHDPTIEEEMEEIEVEVEEEVDPEEEAAELEEEVVVEEEEEDGNLNP